MNNIQNLAKKTILKLLISSTKTIRYLSGIFYTFIVKIQKIRQRLGRKSKKNDNDFIFKLADFLYKAIKYIVNQPYHIKPKKVLL